MGGGPLNVTLSSRPVLHDPITFAFEHHFSERLMSGFCHRHCLARSSRLRRPSSSSDSALDSGRRTVYCFFHHFTWIYNESLRPACQICTVCKILSSNTNETKGFQLATHCNLHHTDNTGLKDRAMPTAELAIHISRTPNSILFVS